ncbi:MAG: hypothetical protein IPF72_05015 [Chitinophagaceae bacterium]|nr:hypothetical protein [Chitinophagaceae bacterium]
MTKQLPLKRLLLTIIVIFSFTIQQAKAQDKAVVLHELNDLLINTVMVDFFTPPVASRIYAYPNIAFYECIRLDDPALGSLSGKLNGLGNLPAPPANIKIDNFIAAYGFSFI